VFTWLIIALALLFLALRAWVRLFRRELPNLSDICILFAWLGFVLSGVVFTLLSRLQFELGSSKNSTVDVNADPEKLVTVLKVSSSRGRGTG
jgi:drug/metabolite transporter (DMT)-like permease